MIILETFCMFGVSPVTVNETEMLFEFYNRVGELKDAYTVMKP